MKGDLPANVALEQARALLEARQLDAAVRLCADVVAREPGHALAWFLHGVALAERRDIAGARASLGRSFALQPSQPPAHRLVHANVLLDALDAAAAEGEARLALRDAADWPPALVTLAVSLHRQGRLGEALELQRRAVERDPGYLRAHSALAATLSDAGRHAEAIEALRSALERWPASTALRHQLAEAHWRAGRAHEAQVFDAIDAYLRAISLDDAPAEWWNDLGNAYANAGLLAQAQDAYREALRRDPAFHQVESNLLINLHYDPRVDAEALFAAHRAWAARHAAPLAPTSAPLMPPRAAGGRLRVAFMSPALREGPTAAFLAPLLEHIDRERFEVHCYQIDGRSDAMTERLRGSCDAWHDVRGETDEAIASRMRADGVHVLVDLAGHAPGGRLLVLARKPVPVIATWLDYFDTTGLDMVDYIVGDPVSTPSGGTQKYVEKVVRVRPCRLCFSEPSDAPAVLAPPSNLGRPFTFGSFNRLSKMGPDVVALWARILDALPASRLLLKNAAFSDPRMQDRVRSQFVERGVEPGRIEMRGHSPHGEMMAEYGHVDIALDPFPYNGGLTTCEALWMGVPVLTLLGNSMISRQSASLLAAAGMSSWIAESPEELIRLAVERAGDIEGLAQLRREMRQRMRDSPLMDGAAFATGFGQALLLMANAAVRADH